MAYLATVGLCIFIGGIIYIVMLLLLKEDLVYAQVKGVKNG